MPDEKHIIVEKLVEGNFEEFHKITMDMFGKIVKQLAEEKIDFKYLEEVKDWAANILINLMILQMSFLILETFSKDLDKIGSRLKETVSQLENTYSRRL